MVNRVPKLQREPFSQNKCSSVEEEVMDEEHDEHDPDTLALGATA